LSITDFEAIHAACAPIVAAKRSMLGPERFRNAGWSVKDVIDRGIPGAIVECGTYRCGALAFMARVVKESGKARGVWGFDTFTGIPAPGEHDGAKSAGRGFSGDLLATLDDARATLGLAKVNPDSVNLVQGLFQDTLHATRDKIGPIAVLRLDGDWYESTKVCLDQLYDQVQPGGWIIIDDYGHWEGCRIAVDEFLAARGLKPELKATDYTERCWVKE
jgi:hypothetical protein